MENKDTVTVLVALIAALTIVICTIGTRHIKSRSAERIEAIKAGCQYMPDIDDGMQSVPPSLLADRLNNKGE